MKKQIQKKKDFRISAKRIYLTYSQVNEHMQSADVLDALNKKNFCFKHVISKEYHKDGGTHFHVLLEATNKFNITEADFLDITYQEKSYHGNYQPVKSLSNVVEYVCKAGDYITDFSNIQQGKILSGKQSLIQNALDLGVSDALLEHCKQLPDKAMASLSLTGAIAYFQAFESLKTTDQSSDIETPFKLKDFNLEGNPELIKWMQDPDKTLVLTGDSGTGKTQFSKAFASAKGYKTLVVNHVEGYKDLTSQHDCIIVDDANMKGLDPTQLLALIDCSQNKTLRVLYRTVNKKKGLVQIITLNKPELQFIRPFLREERFARRMLFSELKSPIINLNVNIQINNTVNNTYQEISDQEKSLVQANRKRLAACL